MSSIFSKSSSRSSLGSLSPVTSKSPSSSKRSSIRIIAIAKEGWLYKKGNKRYFILTANNHVVYYLKSEPKTVDEEEVKKKARGCFQLGPENKILVVDDPKKKSFKITGLEKGDFQLTAKSDDELNEWVSILKSAIEARSKLGRTSAANLLQPTEDVDTPGLRNSREVLLEKQGYLTDKNEKRCFYRLRKDHILWFPSEKEAKFLGVLDLLGASLEQTSPFTWVMRNGDTEMELTAKTSEQAKDWIAHINAAILELKKTPLFLYNNEKEWKVRIEMELEGGSPFGLAFKSTDNAQKIKDEYIAKLKDEFPGKYGDIYSTDIYLLKVKNINYYILDEQKPLHALPFFHICRKAFTVTTLELVHKLKLRDQGISLRDLIQLNDKGLDLNVQTENKQQQEISDLIGNSLLTLLATKSAERDNEVNCFRRDMAKLRIHSFHDIKDKLPEYLESEPMPKNVPNQINFICNLPGDKHKTLSCEGSCTIAELKEMIFDKYKKIDVNKTLDKSASDYILKVTGFRSYFVTPEKPLISYDYIRNCINKDEKINLSLVEFDANILAQKEKVPLVDIMLASEEETDLLTAEEYQLRDKKQVMGIQERNTLFNIRISSSTNIQLENLPENVLDGFSFAQVEVYHGGVLIDEPIRTRDVPYSHFSLPSQKDKNTCIWNQTLACTLPLCNIPKAARLSVTLYVQFSLDQEPRPVGWANVQLVDHKNRLATGPRTLRLWPGKVNPIGTCVDNIGALNPTILNIEFENFNKIPLFRELTAARDGELQFPKNSTSGDVQAIIQKDSLAKLSPQDLQTIWESREEIVTTPRALPKFLLSVKWNNPDQIREAYRLLAKWAPLTPVQALELLDSKFADAKVREYAVGVLSQLNDGDLSDYLLQLTQVLKYEPQHDSALARFLLKRALNSKDIVGHPFFWHLKAEMHVPEISERYGLLMEAYLRGCSTIYRAELHKQDEIIKQLTDVAVKIKEIKNKEERLEAVRFQLRQIDFPARFQLPLFTNVECKGLIIEKCKVMTSKKLPLWLVFENADRNGANITVIFKSGDDLRQDVLTLQMIRLMDKLWTREGLHLKLKPYGVISTGNEIGMLQVVLDSETTASINREAGGASSVLVKDVIAKWLRQKNPSDDEYKTAVQTFALSCAGYCVATYVIGIGDRHNDNIMLHKQGNLFHIDFGHFLGHFKTKFGFEREKAPFVFTPQYAHVLGGKGAQNYQLFEETCCKAYGIIRNNSALFINLFSMMLSIGLEELKSVENILFLRDRLDLDMKDEQVAPHFKSLIDESLTTKTTQFMDIVHIIAN